MPFRDWFVTDRLLEQTVEQQPARTRGPTVEAKHEFVEIALQVLDSDRIRTRVRDSYHRRGNNAELGIIGLMPSRR